MTQRTIQRKEGQNNWIDEEQVKDHLVKIVKRTVQETSNTLLDEEVERLCRAKQYEIKSTHGVPE